MSKLIFKEHGKRLVPSMCFRDDLFLFRANAEEPYAFRAPQDTPVPNKRDAEGEMAFESDCFRIVKAHGCIYCSISDPKAPYAVIAPHESKLTSDIADTVKDFCCAVASLELTGHRKMWDQPSVDSLIRGLSAFCGCLTDINAPEEPLLAPDRRYEGRSPYLAIALSTVCLMYRRLSALRGLNFKLIFPEGIPFLAFSAKVLSSGIRSISDIPECSVLRELQNLGGISLYTRLTEEEDDGGEKLSRLILLISSAPTARRDTLHATERVQDLRKKLDKVPLDIPGRY